MAAVMMAVDDGLVVQEFLDPEAVPDDLRARAAVLFFRGMAAEWAERAAATEHPPRSSAETAGTDHH
jgi:hypothetical protein